MKPTLKEVKAYFENAKEVRCLYNSNTIDITKNIIREIYSGCNGFWIAISDHDGNGVFLFNEELNKYAEIISYKETFEYLEEVEVSDNNTNIWLKRTYIGNSPCGQYYITWNKDTNCARYFNKIRKLNTERTQAIETIKELMTKHEIKTTEL